MLTPQQRRFWADHGFLVLPGFAADDDLESVRALLARIWEARPPNVVVDDLVTGARNYLRDVEVGPESHAFKVNDLYLEYEEVRRLALGDRIAAVLAELLEDRPVLVNSLNFERGSQQPYHVDSIYMTPKNIGNLAATWVALEDCHLDAGPLAYYPESHRILPYQFLDGGYHFHPDEMDPWNDYVFSEIEQRGLGSELFAAQTGDVFIWSANLLHGGSPINDPSLSRHSLVSHFWTQRDCEAAQVDLVPCSEGFWLRRAPQQVPEGVPTPPRSHGRQPRGVRRLFSAGARSSLV